MGCMDLYYSWMENASSIEAASPSPIPASLSCCHLEPPCTHRVSMGQSYPIPTAAGESRTATLSKWLLCKGNCLTLTQPLLCIWSYPVFTSHSQDLDLQLATAPRQHQRGIMDYNMLRREPRVNTPWETQIEHLGPEIGGKHLFPWKSPVATHLPFQQGRSCISY
jgi:hypothetical protein